MKRVGLVITSHAGEAPFPRATGYWREEVSAFYNILRDAGCEVVFMSPKGGLPPLDLESADPNNSDNRRFLGDADAQQALSATLKTADVDALTLDAIYCAGGHGAMWDFPTDAHLGAMMADVHAKGGIIATVCHGAAALLNPRLAGSSIDLSGRTVTGFSNLEERLIGQSSRVPYLLEDRLKAIGARYVGGVLPFTSFVLVDDGLVTGKNPASTRGVAQVLVRLLKKEKDET